MTENDPAPVEMKAPAWFTIPSPRSRRSPEMPSPMRNGLYVRARPAKTEGERRPVIRHRQRFNREAGKYRGQRLNPLMFPKG